MRIILLAISGAGAKLSWVHKVGTGDACVAPTKPFFMIRRPAIFFNPDAQRRCGADAAYVEERIDAMVH